MGHPNFFLFSHACDILSTTSQLHLHSFFARPRIPRALDLVPLARPKTFERLIGLEQSFLSWGRARITPAAQKRDKGFRIRVAVACVHSAKKGGKLSGNASRVSYFPSSVTRLAPATQSCWEKRGRWAHSWSHLAVEPPVSDHPKWQAQVVAHRRWSHTRGHTTGGLNWLWSKVSF